MPKDESGYLEIGCNLMGEVVMNHPRMQVDANGVGHIVFTPRQARNLARILNEKADEAELTPRPPKPRQRHVRDMRAFEREMLGQK